MPRPVRLWFNRHRERRPSSLCRVPIIDPTHPSFPHRIFLPPPLLVPPVIYEDRKWGMRWGTPPPPHPGNCPPPHWLPFPLLARTAVLHIAEPATRASREVVSPTSPAALRGRVRAQRVSGTRRSSPRFPSFPHLSNYFTSSVVVVVFILSAKSAATLSLTSRPVHDVSFWYVSRVTTRQSRAPLVIPCLFTVFLHPTSFANTRRHIWQCRC